MTDDEASYRERWNAKAAELFPARFAEANNGPKRSERLYKLRALARVYVRLAELRSEGRCCGNCGHFEKAISGKYMLCVLGSVFHGDQIAKADGLCTKHKENEK